MLQLNFEQAEALREISRRRSLAAIGQALGEAFAATASRAGERWEQLIEHGVRHARSLGFEHALCAARYLACCFAWGMEFESRPGFEWAAALLRDGRSDAASRIFRLCRRSAEELQRRAPGEAPSSADFDQALALLDGRLQDRGDIGSLLPARRLRLGAPCDVEALELRVEPSVWRQHYTVRDGRWQRVASQPEPLLLRVGDAPLPEQLSLISRDPGAGSPTQLRLRLHAPHACDAAMHPLVALTQADGTREWRGAQAAELRLGLAAQPPWLGDTAAPGYEDTPSYALLQAQSCGLRASGPALGRTQTRLALYPSAQWLAAWRHEPLGPLELDASSPDTAPAAAQPRVRLERDGRELDAQAWQQRLQELDQQLHAGLQRLLVAWSRGSGVQHPRLQATPVVLGGAASLGWGWRELETGLAGTPLMHMETLFELVACELGLRLSGQLELDGSRSELSLSLPGRAELKGHLMRDAAQPDAGKALQAAQCSFAWPFELQLVPLASPELSLASVAAPPSGMLRGSCGLRRNPAGGSWQWFAQLAIEPVSARIRLRHPVLGEHDRQLALLPACKLLDWSLG